MTILLRALRWPTRARTTQLLALRVATGGATSALAAKQTTTSIPIVFSTGGDPIKEGLVASVNRPGGNVSGAGLEAKRLEILHEVLPSASVIGVLINPNNANAAAQSAIVQDAGRTMGQKVLILHASSEREFAAAFTTMCNRESMKETSATVSKMSRAKCSSHSARPVSRLPQRN